MWSVICSSGSLRRSSVADDLLIPAATCTDASLCAHAPLDGVCLSRNVRRAARARRRSLVEALPSGSLVTVGDGFLCVASRILLRSELISELRVDAAPK